MTFKLFFSNSRLDEIQAAVLLLKLKYLQQWNEKRRKISAFYTECLINKSFIPQKIEPGVESNFHLYVVQSENRDEIIKHFEQKGIQSLIHYPIPVHKQPAYADYFLDTNLPKTEEVSKCIFSIPNYPELKDSEVEHIGNVLKEAGKKFAG